MNMRRRRTTLLTLSSDLCEPILPACPEKKVCAQVGKLPGRLRTEPA